MMNESPSCLWLPQVHAWHDGQAAPQQASQVQSHVASCPCCSAELAWLQANRKAFDRLGMPPMADDWKTSLEHRLTWSLQRPLMRLNRWLTAAAAMLAIASLSLVLGQGGQGGEGARAADLATSAKSSGSSVTEMQAWETAALTIADVSTEEQKWTQWHLAHLTTREDWLRSTR